jgi:hypothetical protein
LKSVHEVYFLHSYGIRKRKDDIEKRNIFFFNLEDAFDEPLDALLQMDNSLLYRDVLSYFQEKGLTEKTAFDYIRCIPTEARIRNTSTHTFPFDYGTYYPEVKSGVLYIDETTMDLLSEEYARLDGHIYKEKWNRFVKNLILKAIISGVTSFCQDAFLFLRRNLNSRPFCPSSFRYQIQLDLGDGRDTKNLTVDVKTENEFVERYS